MNAIEKMSDSDYEAPVGKGLGTVLMGGLMLMAFTLIQERPAMQRYLNIRSMARDKKPTR